MKSLRLIFLPTLILICLSLTACSSMNGKTTQMQDFNESHPDTHHADLQLLQEELSKTQNKISSREAELSRTKNVIASQKVELSALALDLERQKQRTDLAKMEQNISVMPAAAMQEESLFPPNAKLGECYARVFVPHQVRTVTAKLLKKEAAERIEIIPAQYETVTQTIMKEQASERLEMVPATFEWVEEEMLVEEAKSFLEKIPAVYETVTEKVLVRPAHVSWKKGTGPIQKIDNITGEIMCLVEEPAIFKTVSKQVLKTAARTKRLEEPAKYATVKKRVMTSPPTTRIVKIPPKYEDIQVVKLVTPAQEKRITIPEEFQTVTKKEVVSDSRMDWISILCATNMTNSKIVDIQEALKTQGYDPGSIDGVIGSNTMAAVNDFQAKKGLIVSKYVTIDTLNALGVSPR